MYLNCNGDKVAKLSTAMYQRITDFENKGYVVSDVEISYVIAWKPKNEEQETAVCLANLVLNKTEK